uniref:Uncharacterized protein n=1 Tax=viral metagenome TaxID=1070528 RepID=A0A6M3Y1M6_9ZZZZ
MAIVGKYKPGVPGAKLANYLWGKIPHSKQMNIYPNPDVINLALMYAMGKGKPVNVNLTPDQMEAFNASIDRTSESDWVPSSNVGAGRTAEKGYSHYLSHGRQRSPQLHDILGSNTTISRYINPTTKDTSYTYMEDWDLKRGDDNDNYLGGRSFNTVLFPRSAKSLLGLYKMLGYLKSGMCDSKKSPMYDPDKTTLDIGVTDKFINASRPVPMNLPSIYRPYKQGNK